MLPLLIAIPLIAGVLAWLLARFSANFCRWICLLAFVADLILLIAIWLRYGGSDARWMLQFSTPWIPQFGITFYLAMDGLSLLLLFLCSFLGIIAVAVSWREITKSTGFFHFNLMWVVAGLIGLFIAMDLFLFYFFWELMLVPMYFLIAIWGHENRRYASFKFFLFTQGGGLLLLLAILGLYFLHGQTTGTYTFNYDQLLLAPVTGKASIYLMLGFLIAFLVKLPAVPFYTWLPDAHTEAPTAGSVILAGLMLKSGAYGILRFVLPLFPAASHWFAPAAMAIGVIGIIYGAIQSFAQTDFKRLVAYTSVSHMGFILLGAFSFNAYGLQGAVMQILCHGLSTGALFVIVGILYERLHTRDMLQMGGLWAVIPRMSGFAMFFAMASLGLPGLGNFIAEFLTLVGAFKVAIWAAALGSIGVVYATVYSLWIMQLVFQGPAPREYRFGDLLPREWLILGSMAIALLWLGLYPQPVLNAAARPLDFIQQKTSLNTIQSTAAHSIPTGGRP